MLLYGTVVPTYTISMATTLHSWNLDFDKVLWRWPQHVSWQVCSYRYLLVGELLVKTKTFNWYVSWMQRVQMCLCTLWYSWLVTKSIICLEPLLNMTDVLWQLWCLESLNLNFPSNHFGELLFSQFLGGFDVKISIPFTASHGNMPNGFYFYYLPHVSTWTESEQLLRK